MKQKGITLISLVVTIIILIILAGITISTLVGENGLIARVKQTKQAQIEAEMKEQLILALQDLQLEKTGDATLEDVTEEWICKKIKNYVCKVEESLISNTKEIIMRRENTSYKFLVDIGFNVTQMGQYEDITYKIKTTTPIINTYSTEISSLEANTQTRGTILYINFSATIEGEDCTIEPKVPYAVTGNGKYKFTITGTYLGETLTKEIEVTVDQYKAEGGFVSYDAGDWTEEEINSLKTNKLYDLNVSHSQGDGTFKLDDESGLNFTFGGFTYKGDTENESNIRSGAVITSRNQSISPENGYETPKYNGWQILESTKKNGKTYVIKLVHAGSPENFVFYFMSTYDSYRAEYLLSSGKSTSSYLLNSDGKINNIYKMLDDGKTEIKTRNWDMYKDKKLDSKGYIKEVYAMTYSEANSALSNIKTIGSPYWLGSASSSFGLWGVFNDIHYCDYGIDCFGVRPVVLLESGVYISSGDGTETSPYILEKE